jgi:hypothetical protein
MKHKITIFLPLLAASLLLAGCSGDEVYDTAVTRNISLTMDGEPWSIYYGTTNKPLFVYKDNGEYVANYSSSYRFTLDKGNYKIIATDQSDLIDAPSNLNDMIIPQDTLAKQAFGISAPTDYQAGQDMQVNMYTRTGMLRLKSTDVKADKSYSSVRATVTSPVTGYNVGTASYVVNESSPIVLTRTKATSNGGINWSDDFILLGTQPDGRKVNVRLDYLDANGHSIKQKTFADDFEIVPNDTTIVSFALNNVNEPVIIDYKVSLSSQEWTDDNVTPGAPLVVPDGYTYVAPSEDLSSIIATELADESVSEIKLFLKAGETYSLGTNALSSLTKSLKIVGQTPARSQAKATLSMGAVTPDGNIDEISFQNLAFDCGSRFFNVRNQNFNIGTISFDGCQWDNWSGGVIWYQNTSSASASQHIGTLSLTGCTLTNWTYRSNALLGKVKRNPATVDKLVLHNNTIQGTYSSVDNIYMGYDNVDLSNNTFKY